MNTNDKYPNADTSPERLAEIQKNWECDSFISPRRADQLRDLLAMVHLYKVGTDGLAVHIQVLEKQLRDQRWRLVAEELPHENERVLAMNDKLNDPTEQPRVLYYNNSYGNPWRDGNGAGEGNIKWWRPIPPLPKE